MRHLPGRLAFAPLVLVPILTVGCANPGPPKPPSLRLPRPAEKLSAERTGDRVSLTWSTAPDTTDGGGLRGPIVAIICRDDAPKPPPPAPIYPTPAEPCRPIQRLNVVPGPSQVTDVLPAALAAGPLTLIAYRVELKNNRGHSAGRSMPAYSVAGAAPSPTGVLSIAPRRNAVLITWQPGPSPVGLLPAPMHVERSLIATSDGPVAPPEPKTKLSAPKTSSPSTHKHETLRQASLLIDTAPDPGGMFDRSLHDGDTLTYTAQRIRSAIFTLPETAYSTRDGKQREMKSAPATLEVRGEPSDPKTFTFHDVVPPSVPTGLAAIPGGGFGEPPSIDLSWEPNPEVDILGYDIERADTASGPYTRLNPAPLPASSFRDLTAQPGHRYHYRVSAVDQRQHESAATSPVQTGLR